VGDGARRSLIRVDSIHGIQRHRGPHIGRVAVVPNRKKGFKNPLRRARYRVCNASFDFADGIACGIMMERRLLT